MPDRFRIVTPPAIPAAALVAGKPAAEAAAMLGRVFNLCRAAQEMAARAAFGLPVQAGGQEALRREILRDHVLKFCVQWPALLGITPLPLPAMDDQPALARGLFGPARQMPADMPGLRAFMQGGAGIAPVLARVAALFPVGQAVCPVLPEATPDKVFGKAALENSVAGRQARHPLMQAVEGEWGRGPVWRLVGRALDVAAMLRGGLPKVFTPAPGRAVVMAARGAYAIDAELAKGRVTRLARFTPTDHMLAPGGILAQSLATLAPEQAGRAPLLLGLLDPCVPVELQEMAHA